MTDALYQRIVQGEIFMTEHLFNSLVYVYTESQQWSKVNSILSSVCMNPKLCAPNKKTVQYIKRNLLYCFEAQVRGQLKNTLESFETMFFQGAS